MRQELANNLILRSLSEGHESDRRDLPDFYQRVFGEAGDEDALAIGIWTRDLMRGDHPSVTLDDIWVVVDAAHDEKIVSALLLIPQTWYYEDVPLPVGRVEIVATDKDYRQRGLIRALINAAHQRSESYGHLMQGITGIGHYYRRFGYGMAIDLGIRAILPFSAVPKLKDGESPRYTLRPAVESDVPRLAAWDQYHMRHFGLSHPRPEAFWRYEFTRSPGALFYMQPQIVTSVDGEEVGYVGMRAGAYDAWFACNNYVVGPESSYLDTFDDVMRGLKKLAGEFYTQHPEVETHNILFDSSTPEAVDTLVRKTFAGQTRKALYAWYVRVADMPRFMRTIAPVLERRLRESGAHRFTGALKIAFYDLTGVTLYFDEGRLIEVMAGEMSPDDADAAFPYHAFLSVVLGHRTADEIEYILPETFTTRKGALLLEILFPPRRAWVFPMA